MAWKGKRGQGSEHGAKKCWAALVLLVSRGREGELKQQLRLLRRITLGASHNCFLQLWYDVISGDLVVFLSISTHTSLQPTGLSRWLSGFCLLEVLAPNRSIVFPGTYGLCGKTWKKLSSAALISIVVSTRTSCMCGHSICFLGCILKCLRILVFYLSRSNIVEGHQICSPMCKSRFTL